jgi:apolipoprotein N-acyltransferase
VGNDRRISDERMPRAREYALLILAGGLLALAFPPVDLVPVAFVALVPFFFVVRRTRPTGLWSAARPGLVAGIAFFLPLLYWLVFLSSEEMKNPVLMSGPLLLLVLLQSLYWALFCAGSSWVLSRSRAPAWLVLPVFWVACEQLRSLFVLGFTWGDLGYVGVAAPRAVQFASVTGVLGVSFWIALVNALILELFLAGRRRRALATALVIVLVLPWVHGTLVLRGAGESAEPPRTVRVAVIQPNISAETKWDARYKDASFEVLEALTSEVTAASPDLIVWPETAAPSYLLREPVYLERVASAARRAKAPILTGCPDLRPGADGTYQTFNSVILVGADGTVRGRYDKIHLVPFGEAIPFETAFPVLKRVNFGEADFRPGRERVVFEIPKTRFSALICFESAFPRLVRQFVDNGSELLVNVTNDIWYGRTSMPFQHAAMAVMRSIETRRSLARSANSGVSLAVDPYGRVLGRKGIFERGTIVADLPVVSRKTFYTEHGDLLPWAAIALSVLLAGAPLVPGCGSGRARRRPATTL